MSYVKKGKLRQNDMCSIWSEAKFEGESESATFESLGILFQELQQDQWQITNDIIVITMKSVNFGAITVLKVDSRPVF